MNPSAHARALSQVAKILLSISVACCAAATAVPAQSAPAPTATAPIPPYPDTAKGLEEFVKTMIKAEKKGDRLTLGAYAKSLALPDPQQWFSSVFGDDLGPKLAAASEGDRGLIESTAPETIADMVANKRTMVEIARFDGSCTHDLISFAPTEAEIKLLELRQDVRPLYDVRFMNKKSWSLWFCFAYVNGGFRYVGHPQVSDAGVNHGSVVRRPEHVTEANLIKRVQPEYPDEAKRHGIQGAVVFHALVGTDGELHSLQLIHGSCVLADAAGKAVKQWEYSPTVIDGKAVQVDTTITVEYSLGPAPY